MRADLDHLPHRQQHELERVRTTLLTEFDAAIHSGGGGTQSWRRDGKVLKIILFGSYARTDWVDEPDNGYLSDFDLLVIVNHEKLTNVHDYWFVAEDKILRDPAVGRTANLIVHTMTEVNQALSRGEYFWTDIIRDGIVLYELPGFPFARPQPMTAKDAAKMAARYLTKYSASTREWLDLASYAISKGNLGDWPKKAAFNLHQAVETAYVCILLVHTFYFPRSHNIKFLRSLAEDVDHRLTAAWPREGRPERRRFEMLKRAYVEARYGDQYDIGLEDLEALSASARALADLVASVCEERLAALRAAADAD
ncbi:DNA-binding protein [Brevundimonas sp. LM2]|uniref:nucleotidyltransferase and HEPN domain-containing protein n=1 Tax=Brevundimonas sp. LM2 TaxID=1938605 RepID=UPI0009839A46|nr:nucleotidyltransferase and HEPN domain-containing protein [Brevundimonas sp. LM2]AQR63163.1 DNA-binding protein [Brevundimonas sp. LM2]